MFMLICLLLGAAGVAPLLQRRLGGAAGYVLALAPAAGAVFFAFRGFGAPWVQSWAWAPALGLELGFRLDGWAALFALLICGIGALVVVYASYYMEGDPDAGRFMSALMVFMASMLGVVLSDSLILMFIFWELTSITSYLLIGHEHSRESARRAALQAMLVTGGGGLFLLAGLVLLGLGTGQWTFSSLLADPGRALAGPHASAALVLILIGCFTKSAQVPFHFWLPNAMEAPTPASAYLHSSTMVKAGVYLLGRLLPILGAHAWWGPSLQTVGWATFLFGAWMVLRTSNAKRVLAYTTLSALGLMVLLLGTKGDWAVKGLVLLLPAHALYKGALFLLAGALHHETGEKDLERMGGLRQALPTLFLGGLLAAGSMVGLAPFLGFLAKETLLETLIGGAWFGSLTALAALGLLGSAGLAVGVGPFLGKPLLVAKAPHAPSLGLWVPPVLLGGVGLLAGVFPSLSGAVTSAAAKALAPGLPAWSLSLWHGWTPAFAAGLLALGASLALWRLRPGLLGALRRVPSLVTFGPDTLYHKGLKGLVALAHLQTRWLQTGYLRHYLSVILGVAAVVALAALVRHWPLRSDLSFEGVRWFEAGLVLVVAMAVLWCIQARTRLGVVAALGIIGYSIALIFVIFGAPDLAMTQFVVETLTVILFVLTLRRLPPFFRASKRGGRFRDGVLATLVGLAMAGLTWVAASAPKDGEIKAFFLERSFLEAHGRNVVNVILVDFRGLDTLGEITVLAVVAVGALALLRLRMAPDGGRS